MPFNKLQIKGTGSTVAPKPFDIFLTTVSNQPRVQLLAGAVNQYVPQGMFTKFSYDPAGVSYIYVRASTNGREVTSATLFVSATPPNPIGIKQSSAPLQFDVLIGVISLGSPFKTWGGGNIQATLTEAFEEDKSNPTPGLSPVVKYYTWAITVGA